MRLKTLILLLGLAALGFSAWLAVQPVSAAPQAPASSGGTVSLAVVSNQRCLECHGQPGLTMTLKNGDVMELYVDPVAYNKSIHGTDSQKCVDCHTQVGDYGPIGHATRLSVESRRAATMQYNQTCVQCHEEQVILVEGSVHATFQAAGDLNAATCSDCHTAHAIRRLTDKDSGLLLDSSRVIIPQMCARCHSAIYDKYRNSVHGAALIDEKNVDVPTCIDCHGVHNIGDPRTAAFRLNSPQLCAGCHIDSERMDKYGISTQVLNTYVADFHGTTVTIFENIAPDAATNKPVCFDCHGVHNITRADDPIKGLQVRENLLARCQVCHPNANTDFPDAWLSHYIPTPDKYPWVYYVNLFYKFLIPGVLGGMGALVVMDFSRSMINRYSHTRLVKAARKVFSLKKGPTGKEGRGGEAHHG